MPPQAIILSVPRWSSMRRFWGHAWASHLVWITPLLTVLLLWLVAERGFHLPMRPDSLSLACLQDPPPTVAVNAEGALVVSLPPPAAGALPAPDDAWMLAECEERLKVRLARQASAAEPRARMVLGVTYAIGLAFSSALAVISLFTIGRFRGWKHAGKSLSVAFLFSIPLWNRWLPHDATFDLVNLLRAMPDGGDAARHGNAVARCGCGIVMTLAALYTLALYALAKPLSEGKASKDGLDKEIEELSMRFERLTTLSYLGAVAFVLALMTLIALLQWPLSLAAFGPVPNNTATALITLFGAYLTSVLTASYLPAAAILENQAEQLAHASLNAARPAHVLAMAREAVRQDHAGLADRLSDLETSLTAIRTLLDAERTASPMRVRHLVAALREAGLDPEAAGLVRGSDDLAARRDWLQKRGLTVVSTARLGASFATLLPLLAGGVSSTLTAVSPLVAALPH